MLGGKPSDSVSDKEGREYSRVVFFRVTIIKWLLIRMEDYVWNTNKKRRRNDIGEGCTQGTLCRRKSL